MADEVRTPDGKPAPAPAPIPTDASGDPIRQGSLMNEKQSYERVIEGLKIASDAAAHLLKHEPENADQWHTFCFNLDKCRRICVQKAGLGLAMKEKETSTVRGDPMNWRKARDRFHDGLVQVAGGMRQLATCHRGDLWWSTMAGQVEELDRKTRNRKTWLPSKPGGKLILPTGYSRH